MERRRRKGKEKGEVGRGGGKEPEKTRRARKHVYRKRLTDWGKVFMA